MEASTTPEHDYRCPCGKRIGYCEDCHRSAWEKWYARRKGAVQLGCVLVGLPLMWAGLLMFPNAAYLPALPGLAVVMFPLWWDVLKTW